MVQGPAAAFTTIPRAEQPRVLVVGHNKTYLSVLARRIAEGGYRVAAADGGAAAIAELHRSPVDLVIAELEMPRMSGAELTRLIRGESAWRDLPVMLIAGRSDSAAAVQAYDAGADDVILKPFHFEILIARIGRRIAGAQWVHSLRNDNAALDARVVTKAIELGEARERLRDSEAERRRLELAAGRSAA